MDRKVLGVLVLGVAVGVATGAEAALNKCAAAKRVCVAKKAAALLGCYAKAAKPPGLKPGKLEACVRKVEDKFDGGSDPAKGCFAKLERKFAGSCLTTADTSNVEADVDAFVAAINCTLDAAACLPRACLDIRSAALAESGQAPPDGSYTLYVDRNPNRPWTAFCRNLGTPAPSDYLTVVEASNFSQLSDGAVVTQTNHRRLRIDPVALRIDLLDDRFATTEAGALPPPGGRLHLPAGFAEFVSPNADDGPPAEARLDLGGTGFVMAESVLADNLAFFCAITNDGAGTPGDGNVTTVSSDLSWFTLSAIDPVANSTTKVVADCPHLSVPDADITTGTLPLQYVGGS